MSGVEIMLAVIGTVGCLNLVGLLILSLKVARLATELDIRGRQVLDLRGDHVAREEYYQLRQEIKTLEKHFGVEIVHRPATKEIRVIDND
jgi:hypothetical protein